MGDGLKRAAAYARATRLTPDAIKFLHQLMLIRGPATRGKLGCVVDRKEDRARQLCRRLGFARFEHGAWYPTDDAARVMKSLKVI